MEKHRSQCDLFSKLIEHFLVPISVGKRMFYHCCFKILTNYDNQRIKSVGCSKRDKLKRL